VPQIKSLLIFPEITEDFPKLKTKVWNVYPKGEGPRLGRIGWYAQWRRYTFAPTPNTIFDVSCLQEIAAFITARMDERK
jgi:hypothetical protein